MTLKTAELLWQTDHLGNRVPTSAQFDDVYFSHASGRDESLYVFCDGNHLSKRFADIAKADTPTCFVIAETGFGTGLNFLVVSELWCHIMQHHQATNPRLHFVSTEKYPLSHTDLTQALSVWQTDKAATFSTLSQSLIDSYPLPMHGNHRRHFYHNGQSITLDLWLGDALDSFNAMQIKADAWFLDGFAPTKNSELWSDDIFSQIKRLSKPDATLATFTSSGTVRRALQDIGMTVQKIKGFGRKREMITAKFERPIHVANPAQQPNQKLTKKTATVIGAGVSGLFTAYALAMRGVQVTLIDKTAPLAGASGNLRALFSPKITNFDNAYDNFALSGFLYAQAVYRNLNRLSASPIFEQTGVLDCLLPTTKTDDKLQELVHPYPDELIRTQTASPFLAYLPCAGLVNPRLLSEFILTHDNITFVQADIHHLTQQDEQIFITSNNQTWATQTAIICLGFESHTLHPAIFETRKIRGQVSWLTDKTLTDALPHHAYKYDGYACAFGDTLLFGASFVRNTADCRTLDDDHLFNIDKLSAALPQFQGKFTPTDLHGRASIRGQTPDYHPMVGQVGDGIYVCSAMGSKGFSLAPLCGQIIAALILQEPLPISMALLSKISPHRPRLQTPLTA